MEHARSSCTLVTASHWTTAANIDAPRRGLFLSCLFSLCRATCAGHCRPHQEAFRLFLPVDDVALHRGQPLRGERDAPDQVPHLPRGRRTVRAALQEPRVSAEGCRYTDIACFCFSFSFLSSFSSLPITHRPLISATAILTKPPPSPLPAPLLSLPFLFCLLAALHSRASCSSINSPRARHTHTAGRHVFTSRITVLSPSAVACSMRARKRIPRGLES